MFSGTTHLLGRLVFIVSCFGILFVQDSLSLTLSLHESLSGNSVIENDKSTDSGSGETASQNDDALSQVYSIRGFVFLYNDSEHMGTTVSIALATVPSISVNTIILLVIGASIFLFFSRKGGMVLFVIAAFLCCKAVLVQADTTVITGISGEYLLTNNDGLPFDPGEYTITFEHMGYVTQELQIVVQADGYPEIVAPDVTLCPTGNSETIEWARRAGLLGEITGFATTTNSVDGSYFVAGEFKGHVWFGLDEANETMLTSCGHGNSDLFVAKYDASGALDWAKSAVGSEPLISQTYDSCYGASVDTSDGSVVVTGLFYETITFAKDEPEEVTLVPTYFDLFLAKYTANGTLAWVKHVQASSVSHEGIMGHAVSINSDDNSIFVTGTFSGTVIFGEGEPNETVLSVSPPVSYQYDIFIAKYNADGSLNWAKQVGGIGYDLGKGISVNPLDGSAVVTGEFYETVIFGVGEPDETTLSGQDIVAFVAKYNSNGSIVWAKSADGPADDHGESVSVNENEGTVVITGYFEETIFFGVPGSTLTSNGEEDIFIAKYSLNGNFLWRRGVGGPDKDIAYSTAVNSTNNTITVTGEFDETVTFGQGEPNEITLTAIYSGAFLAKYNPDGSLLWALDAGRHWSQRSGVSINYSDGSAVMCGNYTADGYFGPLCYVAKRISSSGSLLWEDSYVWGGETHGKSLAVNKTDGTSVVTGYFRGGSIFGFDEPNETTMIVYGE